MPAAERILAALQDLVNDAALNMCQSEPCEQRYHACAEASARYVALSQACSEAMHVYHEAKEN